MKLRKGIRILLWSAGILAAGAASLYLLRWPLFGGTVRARAAALALELLQADVDFGHLGGSLLSGIEARDVTLHPRPGSPFRSARIDRLTAEYGFLGSGQPSLSVDGARVVLAPKDGPAPPVHESIADVVSVLRSLRFPGSVSASNVELVLPDGRSVKLDRGRLDHAAWSVSLRTDGFGTVDGKAALGADGALSFEGRATEGPIRSAKLDLGSGAERCTLKISTELENIPLLQKHPLGWEGSAFFDKNRLVRIEGELTVKEGRAKTRVDLLSGRVEADVDAVMAVDQELKGDLAITGRAEGPLVGPGEAWSIKEARVKTRGARIRNFTIDEADLELGAGSLEKIPFKGSARGGGDQVRADGVFRWADQKPDLETTVDASVTDIAPYLALLKDAPPLKCRQVRGRGKLIVRDGNGSFDGSLELGPGELDSLAWESASFKGLLAPDQIEAGELIVTGTRLAGSPFVPTIIASGQLKGDLLSLRFTADKDSGEIGGKVDLKTGAFEGRLRLEGPMVWLDRGFGIRLSEEILPVKAEGKVTREKRDTRVMLDITGKAGFTTSPTATIRREQDDWIIAVAPGTVTLPKRRVGYEAFVFSLVPGKASLENVKLTCSDPQLEGRIAGSATWDAKAAKIVFRMTETRVAGTLIDPLFARVTIDVVSGAKDLNLRWGKEDGDHLHVQGRWGKELDLTAQLLVGDLKRPLVRDVLRAELEGAVSIDAHVSGTPEEPQLTGTLNLMKISTAGLPPLSLVVPIRSTKDGIRLWSVAEKTPYGALTIEGTLPALRLDALLDLRLQLLTDDLSPLTDRMTKQARVWIPRGGLAAELWLRGPASKPELGGRAEFRALRWQPPAPLGEAADLRITARLDRDGVEFETVDGLLGQGPFWAQGRWDVFLPDTPLRLWVTAWDALVVEDPLARIRVKPDVVLSWRKGQAVKLAGRVEIPLALYHREFTTSTPGGRAVRQVSPPRLRLIPGETGGYLIPGIEGLEGLDIDLAFATTGECRIENSVIGVMFHGEGQLTGTAAEPELSGVFRSRENRGEVKLAPGNFLRIESLEAVLPEEVGRTPSVRFQGRVGAGEGAIQVLVEGPLDNPGLVLKSEPPQPQKDLLARLAFGQTSGAVSREAGVAAVAIYIYEQAKEDWPSADRKEGFFDKFRPSVVPGDTSLQRRVPWELPPVGTLRSTSLRTEYVYNSFFSIVAETNREGDVGGDLKLRIRF